VGKSAQTLFVQYASERFAWSYGTAGMIITLRATVNLGLFFLFLPRLSSHLAARMSPLKKDRKIAQWSACILIVGAATIALAPEPSTFVAGVAIIAMGWGFAPALRSLAAGLIPLSAAGLLTTVIGLAGSLGTLLAGPALALSFKFALGLDKFWLGLPYMIAAVLFLAAAGLVYSISLPEADEHNEVNEEADDCE
jgi:MFS family permease